MTATAASEAREAREAANALFRAGEHLRAAAAYTKALKQPLEPRDKAVLLSNRSCALLRLSKVAKALEDAEASVMADPSFAKGWARKGLALEAAEKLEDALASYQHAAQVAACDAEDASATEYEAKVKALAKALNRRANLSSKLDKAKARQCPQERAALAWAEAKLAYAAELVAEQQAAQGSSSQAPPSFPPELHVLTSSSSSSSDTSSGGGAAAEESAVRAAQAFAAPEVYAQFVAAMRAQAAESGARAVLLIAPKGQVSFPQTWRHHTWPYGEADGVFVQLQAALPAAEQPQAGAAAQPTGKLGKSGKAGSKPDQGKAGKARAPANAPAAGSGSASEAGLLRRSWFIRVRPGKPPSEPQEVSQDFELLPPLLKA